MATARRHALLRLAQFEGGEPAVPAPGPHGDVPLAADDGLRHSRHPLLGLQRHPARRRDGACRRGAARSEPGAERQRLAGLHRQARPASRGRAAGLMPQLQTILGPGWKAALPMVSSHGTVNPEVVLPAVLMHQIPSGLRGLLIVALLSALMGALTGQVNTASSLFVRDVYQNFLRPGAPQPRTDRDGLSLLGADHRRQLRHGARRVGASTTSGRGSS